MGGSVHRGSPPLSAAQSPHSAGMPTALLLSLLAPRESPERLCPDSTLHRLCSRAGCGTASIDTSTSMLMPSLQTNTGLQGKSPKGDVATSLPGTVGVGKAVRKGTCQSPLPAQHSSPSAPVGRVLALAQHAPREGHRAG